jgi:hypothetical protein
MQECHGHHRQRKKPRNDQRRDDPVGQAKLGQQKLRPSRAASVPDPQSPIDAVENTVMINPRLASRQ